ncbi:hypothetical protein IM697_29060 [Streptomyces ferrugineus]|uniref:Uncharacterized protein n=1 Tax=Streptomyces ferrugineus TaxID=1413221 RepID=A0A7M2SCZ0_9ACTN|nr:hypothetical protein [Streptomyces ferrugineus]QOV34180.1 hypothetical protein IM697_29060 [Streptomyces ferrugineus]
MEAAEQGRSTEFTSLYEVNGILTGASEDIALDLIREGGNRTVGLVFRRARKDGPSIKMRPIGQLGHRVFALVRLVGELSAAQ